VLLIAYLLFLPAEEKCKIMPNLKGCAEEQQESVPEEEGKIFLLSEQPGFLQPIEETAEYKIGSIDLFNREVTEIPLKLSAEPVIEKSWFNSRTIKQEFVVPGRAKKVTLFLGLKEASSFASLVVIVNGNVVTRVIGSGVHIVELPSETIKNTNTLELRASTPILPGLTNRFRLNSLILKEKYLLTQGKVERNFIIEENINDINSAKFEFNADCYSTEPLVVKLNDKIIVNEKICTEFKNEIRNFLEQNNKLVFSTNGNYYIQDVRIKIKFKQRDFVTYYFTVNKENYEKLENGEVLAMLRLRFPDREHKEITVYINGNPVNIDTEKIEYKTAISRLLLKGQNSIKIVPDIAVSLNSVEIYLE
jgi:hypothetical protein